MPIKNFSSYLIEEDREVYFTFGRMNPPTIGHGKVMDVLASKSGKSDYKVYLSQSVNPKKDPLSYADKVKHTRKMFPKHARQVILACSISQSNYMTKVTLRSTWLWAQTVFVSSKYC